MHDGEEDEELVDYESSPIPEATHNQVIFSNGNENEDDTETFRST